MWPVVNHHIAGLICPVIPVTVFPLPFVPELQVLNTAEFETPCPIRLYHFYLKVRPKKWFAGKVGNSPSQSARSQSLHASRIIQIELTPNGMFLVALWRGHQASRSGDIPVRYNVVMQRHLDQQEAFHKSEWHMRRVSTSTSLLFYPCSRRCHGSKRSSSLIILRISPERD
ncbi:hypothetical protein N431DRAFT_58798 [Stipitochalara longipes BDJ]|nr:hypothetical protein N431DRAFT_58798 [Stipitochalara longipes BDJ]